MTARIACRQLGFDSGAYNGVSSSSCQDCSGTVYSFTCTGEESMLVDCPHTTSASNFSGIRVTCD